MELAIAACRQPRRPPTVSFGVKFSPALVVAIAALALPGGAAAARCAPPGTSGVSQYYETVPGAGCNRPPGSGGAGKGGLSGAARRRLAAQGPTGVAVERLIESNAPPAPKPHRRRKNGSPAGAPAIRAPGGQTKGAHGEDPLSAVVHAIIQGSPGGSGPLLAVLLAAVLALMLGVAARRRIGNPR